MADASSIRRTRLFQVARVILAIPIGFFLLLGVVLFLSQRKLMYHPRPYDPNYTRMIEGRVSEISFQTADGTQRAFYISPRGAENGAPPERLWVFFHGNAGQALDWIDEPFVFRNHDKGAGMLLVDLPGYGASEGSPTRAGIIANGEGAFLELARLHKLDPDDLARRTGVVGYSMGAAAGLELATRHPMRAAIIISPFTSITDMAGQLYGPFKHIALDRFDNRARLDELAARDPAPTVWIFHGAKDDLIPVAMAEELAARQPAITRLHIVEQLDHNWILSAIAGDVQAAMLEAFGVEGEPPPASRPSGDSAP